MEIVQFAHEIRQCKNQLSVMRNIVDIGHVGSFSRSCGYILGLLLAVWVNFIQSGMEIAFDD